MLQMYLLHVLHVFVLFLLPGSRSTWIDYSYDLYKLNMHALNSHYILNTVKAMFLRERERERGREGGREEERERERERGRVRQRGVCRFYLQPTLKMHISK